MEEHDLYARRTESHMRVCLVCHKPIVELKKASYLKVDTFNDELGLHLVAHDRCLESLVEAKHEQGVQAFQRDAVDALARTISKAYVDNFMQEHDIKDASDEIAHALENL